MNRDKTCTLNIPGSMKVPKNQGEGSEPAILEGSGPFSLMPKVYEYVEPKPVQWSCCPGWIIFYLFCIEGISGALLLLYYCPTISEAYRSIQQITNILHYGWLIRGVHIWGVHLLVIAVVLHLAQKFISQGHRQVKRFPWIIGIVMMVLLSLFGATGHLLSWTQGSYWATTFITQLFAAIPLVGEPIKILIRGGNEISQITLSRFFALHILIAPIIFISLSRFHIVSANKSLIPSDLLFHVQILLVLIAVLFSLSTFFPPYIYPKADPFNSLLHIKPEWYFLASYETFLLLRKIHPNGQSLSVVLGILLHLGVLISLMVLPFFSSSATGEKQQRKFPALILCILGLLILLTLTLLGAYS
ncbi:MAG: cytochrome b N-terminal domain-containing protein [bacterium]